ESATCAVMATPPPPGTATLTASGTVVVGGVSIGVATNGYGAHDISNVKTWVDARITINQTATNQANHPHTFTVMVEENDGRGWSPAGGVANTSTATGAGGITGG